MGNERTARPQVKVSDTVQKYLDLKSELTGRPIATLISDLCFDAMRAEYGELLELKEKISKADPTL